jgi:hypothetical protein
MPEAGGLRVDATRRDKFRSRCVTLKLLQPANV